MEGARSSRLREIRAIENPPRVCVCVCVCASSRGSVRHLSIRSRTCHQLDLFRLLRVYASGRCTRHLFPFFFSLRTFLFFPLELARICCTFERERSNREHRAKFSFVHTLESSSDFRGWFRPFFQPLVRN